MMKKILAVAVASAFAAPAFAATANVDVYGVLSVAVESVDNYGATADRKMRVTTGNNSALGVRGSEDLGGGMKAVWQIETNVSVDGNNEGTTGIGAFNGTRNTFVGLASGWGEVRIGVHDTPYKMSTGRLDPFVGTLGDYNTLMGAAPTKFDLNGDGDFADTVLGVAETIPGAFQQIFDNRTSNTIAYISPNMSGFQVMGAYVVGSENLGNAGGNDEKGSAYSLSASYTNGPLFLTAAYEKANLGTISSRNGTTIVTASADDDGDVKAWKLGAGYKIGELGLGLIYEKIDLDATERNGWHAMATYGMGAITLKAAYTKADDWDDIANSGAKMWAVGADYAFSKRTKLYVVYADLTNDSIIGYNLSQGTNTLTQINAGQDPSGFALGVQHSF